VTLQDAYKKYFLLFGGTFTSFFTEKKVIKKSQNSTVKIKVFPAIFA
jgi:hypothetical protein